MAIKIKKKDRSPDSGGEPAEEAPTAALSGDADALTRASWETASWVEENRQIVFGGIAVVLVAIFGGYFGLQFLESQKVEASSSLSPSFDAYSTMVKGSQRFDAVASNPDIETPEKTFESEEKKWEAMYDAASASLSKHPNAEVATAARLAKAAAAVKLEKLDEAVKLYEAARGQVNDPATKVAVLEGLATSYAASEQWQKSIEALDELAKLNEDYAASARYQKARIHQQAGETEKAKELYHEILDADPETPNKADIERRLANM